MTLAYFYTHSHKIAGNVHTSITIARGQLVDAHARLAEIEADPKMYFESHGHMVALLRDMIAAGHTTLWEPVRGEPYAQITWCSVPHMEGEPAWLLPTYRLGDEATEPLVEASFQLVKHCICNRPQEPAAAPDLFPDAVQVQKHTGDGFTSQWYVADFRGNERGK